MPCGACRQVMRKFMDPNTTILVRGVGKFVLEDLLPRAFHL
jgi:cytidine deaminase